MNEPTTRITVFGVGVALLVATGLVAGMSAQNVRLARRLADAQLLVAVKDGDLDAATRLLDEQAEQIEILEADVAALEERSEQLHATLDQQRSAADAVFVLTGTVTGAAEFVRQYPDHDPEDGHDTNCWIQDDHVQIQPGNEVPVYDAQDTIVALGRYLEATRTDSGACRMRFAVQGLPRRDFYTIEVAPSDRVSTNSLITFSFDELEVLEWHIDPVFGDPTSPELHDGAAEQSSASRAPFTCTSPLGSHDVCVDSSTGEYACRSDVTPSCGPWWDGHSDALAH